MWYDLYFFLINHAKFGFQIVSKHLKDRNLENKYKNYSHY